MATLTPAESARLADFQHRGLNYRTALALADTVTQDDLDALATEVSASGSPDATSTVKGKIALAGDLAGTADNPTVPALATKLDSGQLTTALAGKIDVPLGTIADNMIAMSSAAAAPQRIRWGTSQESVARALGWVIITDPQWGGPSVANGNDWTSAIHAATRYIDKFDIATHTYTGSNRGGTIWFPPGLYGISQCIVISARCRLLGASGMPFGGYASRIVALAGGAFTNVDNYTGEPGLNPGFPWMLRLSRNGLTNVEWFHGGRVQDLAFDCNNLFVGGIVGAAAGEGSLLDNIQVVNSGVQARTLSATFNGTDTVTLAAGDLDQLEDWKARVDSASFPTFADVAKTDASVTVDSAVVTFPSGVGTIQVGSEVTGGNSGFRLMTYVVSVNSGANQITLSEPLRALEGGTATGKTMNFGRPRDQRIEQIDSATQIKLTRPVPYTGTGTLTIYRPRPGMRLYYWSATGRIGYLNLVGNSGSGLEMLADSNRIEMIAGDNNGGAMIRFHQCNTPGDPGTTYIGHIKSENNNYGNTGAIQYENYGDHDPAVAFTQCGMINVEIDSMDAYAGDRASQAVVRMQQANGWASGYPSVSIRGVEAENPWNVGFRYLLYDRDSGKGVTGGNIYSPTFGGRFYPDVKFNKDGVRYGDEYLRQVPVTGLGGNMTLDGTLSAAGVSASGLLPSYAAAKPRIASWNPDRGVYNLKPSNTRKLRSDLSKAQRGAARVDWAFYGGAEFSGHNNGNLNAAALQLRDLLVNLGVLHGGSGTVLFTGWLNSGDPRFTASSGTWANAGTPNFFYASANTDGAAVTVKPVASGTEVDIWYLDNGGIFTYAIDGAAPVTVTPGGTAAAVKATVSGLTDGPHTVVITRTDAVNATRMLAVNVYRTTGLVMHQLATVNTYTSTFNGTTAGTAGASFRQMVNPTVAFLGVPSTSMIYSGGTPASYTSDIGGVVDKLRAQSNAPDVVLVLPWSPNDNAGWPAIIAAMYDLAETKGVPLLDLNHLIGGTSATAYNPLGLLNSDNTIPTNAGSRWTAEAILHGLLIGAAYTPTVSTSTLDLSNNGGTDAAVGTALGDKLDLYGGIWGLGMQANRLVAYVGAAGSGGGLAVRSAAAAGAKSSGADAVVLDSYGDGLFNGYVAPGNGTTPGSKIYSGTAAPAISAALGDLYIRKQAPAWRQVIYVCTTAGSATTGAWTPYEEFIAQRAAPDSWEVLGWKSPPILTQGTWQAAYLGSQALTHIGYNLSNTQNDEYRWMANLAKGTYRFDVMTDKGPDRAIETWEMSFDGGTTWTGGTNGLAIGTFDLYAAAAAQNNFGSTTGLVIPQSGPVLVRVRVASRNASNTTGWTMTLTNASLQRTA